MAVNNASADMDPFTYISPLSKNQKRTLSSIMIFTMYNNEEEPWPFSGMSNDNGQILIHGSNLTNMIKHHKHLENSIHEYLGNDKITITHTYEEDEDFNQQDVLPKKLHDSFTKVNTPPHTTKEMKKEIEEDPHSIFRDNQAALETQNKMKQENNLYILDYNPIDITEQETTPKGDYTDNDSGITDSKHTDTEKKETTKRCKTTASSKRAKELQTKSTSHSTRSTGAMLLPMYDEITKRERDLRTPIKDNTKSPAQSKPTEDKNNKIRPVNLLEYMNDSTIAEGDDNENSEMEE